MYPHKLLVRGECTYEAAQAISEEVLKEYSEASICDKLVDYLSENNRLDIKYSRNNTTQMVVYTAGVYVMNRNELIEYTNQVANKALAGIRQEVY